MNAVHQPSEVPIALSYADNEVVIQLSWRVADRRT